MKMTNSKLEIGLMGAGSQLAEIQKTWKNPLPLNLVPTLKTDSFKEFDENLETGLPLGDHPGSFGFRRKHHTHEGVDLYAPEGTVVRAVQDGLVVKVDYFTGPKVGMPWWEETWAVMVEGESGVVVYGEIIPCSDLIGPTPTRTEVKAGDPIGTVKRVLVVDKGRPTSMLHLELRKHGTTDWSGWYAERPENLLDPTAELVHAILRGEECD